MLDLPNSHPWLNQQLTSGRHAVGRSSRHWAALSTDPAIEQVMMKAPKSRCGLIHGCGMTECGDNFGSNYAPLRCRPWHFELSHK